MNEQEFREKYEALQSQWRQLAIDHGHHYLRYLPPLGKVDFVLVAKMPSISEKDAKETAHGEYPASEPHLNLYISMGDLILNYGAHRFLCRPGETYYLTDLGKCAMPPSKAKGGLQDDEFICWYPKFLEELALVAKPNATVIPVGSATGNFLKRKRDEDPSSFPYELAEPILHWSRAATAAAKMASSLFPQEWKDYSVTTHWKDLSECTEEVFNRAGLTEYIAAVQQRFEGKFTDIHKHYMFTYKKEMPLRWPDMC